MVAIAGNITESLGITDWRVSAHRCRDGSLSGTSVTSGNTYSVTTLDTDPCIVTLAPKIDYAWSAGKQVVLDDLVVASNPDATPHIWKATTAPGFSQFSSLSLMLACEGTNNSTTFTDSSSTPKSVSAVGDAVVSTLQSKAGSSSAKFSGAGHLSVPFSSGMAIGNTLAAAGVSGSVGMWIYFTSINGPRGTLLGRWAASEGWTLDINGSGNLVVAQQGALAGTTGASVPTNTWTYVGLRFKYDAGNKVDVIIGNAVVSTFDLTCNSVGQGVTIGRRSDSTLGFIGYIDNIAMAEGIDLFPTGFTPPDQPYSAPSATGATEPTWNLSGTTNDNGVVWTYVAPLVNPVVLGPRVPA